MVKVQCLELRVCGGGAGREGSSYCLNLQWNMIVISHRLDFLGRKQENINHPKTPWKGTWGQMVDRKYKNSGAYHLSEISRESRGVGHIKISKDKDKLLGMAPLSMRKTRMPPKVF